MHIEHSARDDCIVVRLVGHLDLAAAPKVQRALLKYLAEQPTRSSATWPGWRRSIRCVSGCLPPSRTDPAAAGPTAAFCCAVPGRRWPQR